MSNKLALAGVLIERSRVLKEEAESCHVAAELLLNQLKEEPHRVEAGEDINEEGWHHDVAYAWRLLLQNGANSAVVYFATEPAYATVKAFARAAGMPVNSVQVEQRDG